MAKKNAKGEGSRPHKRADGRWEARYWLEGKRRSVYGKSRKEVADKLADALADAPTDEDDAAVFVPSNITVAEFLGQYEDVVRDTMKRRSSETYQSIAKVHLLPASGNLKLGDLRLDQVQRVYSLKRDGGLSAARVRWIPGVLSSALNQAVRWGSIEHKSARKYLRRGCLRRRYARSVGTRRSGSSKRTNRTGITPCTCSA